jgi:PAS domain S-box-containing protein
MGGSLFPESPGGYFQNRWEVSSGFCNKAMKSKIRVLVSLLISILFANSIFPQTILESVNDKYYLQFKILESEHIIGKNLNGDVDSLGFKEYSGKQTPHELPAQNRMLTLRSKFVINPTLEQEDWVLVFPPIFYACNIYLNGNKIAQRGDIKYGYTNRIHTTESYLFPPNLLNKNSNEIAIELFPMYGENNSVNGIFISSRKVGETYTFWRNFFSVDFIRAMSVIAIVIFIYFLIFSFQRKSSNTSYYIPFSMVCLFYPIAFLNNIITFNFSDTLLLEKISRLGTSIWTFFSIFYILEFTKITKYKNQFITGIGIIYFPLIILGWLPDTVPGVVGFNIKYTSIYNIFIDIALIVICFIFAYRTRTKYAFILALTFFLAIPSITFDVYYYAILQTKPYAFTLSYIMFTNIVVFFFIVAWQQSDVYKLTQQQADELKNINENLEQIVEQRTIKLLETNEYLENLFNYANAPIIVWDNELNITRFNHAFEHLSEYQAYEVIGKKIGVLFSDSQREESLRLIIQTSVGNKWESVEIAIRNKSGENRIVLWNSANIKLGSSIVATIAQGQDITEHKKAQLAEYKAKTQLRAILDNSNSIIYLKDKNYNYLLSNKQYEKLFNLQEKDIIGKSDYDIHPEYIANEFRELDQKVIEIQKTITKEEKVEIENEIRYFLSTKFLLYNEESQPYAVGGISTDITELRIREAALRKSETQLRELNATKDKFFSIIAHDLKHPFNSILGFSNLLTTNLHKYNQEKIMEFVQIINISAQNAFNLLGNLLEWSMVQTDNIDFKPEIFILESLVIDTIKITAGNSLAKNIHVSYEIKETIQIFADRNMINTVLRNLLNNAIKYTHKNGTVKIIALTEENTVKVSVRDNGVGINSEKIDKLFTISEKISTQGTDAEKGTGLGLILCKEFVQKNKGRIWVESEIGKGSEFFFTLPLSS